MQGVLSSFNNTRICHDTLTKNNKEDTNKMNIAIVVLPWSNLHECVVVLSHKTTKVPLLSAIGKRWLEVHAHRWVNPHDGQYGRRNTPDAITADQT